ncbi:MAG TPA: ABC transporter ATP-binding protein [Bacteroidales bacterium]|jgi:ABC-2 type transport system ATP-binding protein|nr:ABC transporter ATP-binding protein [Bacteroidales bacterium]
MIKVNELKFGYSKKRLLFDNLNLELKKGHIYGLFGVNGAGKTTLLKHLSGVLMPKEGSVEFNGQSFKERPVSLLQDLYVIPETFSLPPVTVQKFFDIHAPFYPKMDANKFAHCLKEFDLDASMKLNQISYGQQKKFIVAFSLATNASLILMDEPTNGLDIPSKSQFRKLLAQQIHDDSCIVISTHQVRDLASLIDYVIVLDNGTIRFAHEMDEISKKLHFTVKEKTDETVLYSEEQFGGIKAICSKETEKDLETDFELLFNAVISDYEKINNAFKN